MRISIAKCLFLYELILVVYLVLFIIPSAELTSLFNVNQWGTVELLCMVNVVATSMVFWVLIFRSSDSFLHRGFSIGSGEPRAPRSTRKKSKTKKQKKIKKRKPVERHEDDLPLF